MDLSKVSNVIRAKNIIHDLLGNSISVGDIVAIAYHNNMYYGLVYEITDRFIRAYDKIQMDQGKNIQIGRGITGRQCILIQKLLNQDIKESIIKKKDENAQIDKLKKKNTPKKIFLKWKDTTTNRVGFLIWKSISSKEGYKEAIKRVKETYPNFIFDVYSNSKDWISVDYALMSNIKFISMNSDFIGNEYEHKNDYYEYSFSMLEVPIEIYDEGSKIKFRVFNSYKSNEPIFIQNYSTRVFEDNENLKKPITNLAGLNLNIDYIRSYCSYFYSSIFDIAKNILNND